MSANKTASESCKRVITIPQYTGTCWFNAILMATLFSENMRNLLLNKLEQRKQSGKKNVDELQDVIDDIITRRYRSTYVMRDYAYMFFQVVTPEEILRKLHKADKEKFEFNVDVESDRGYFNFNYIYKFLEYLGIKEKDILGLDVKNGKLQSAYTRYGRVSSSDNGKDEFISSKADRLRKGTYDVLVVHENVLYKTKPYDHRETLELYGTTYVLDSVLMTNFNHSSCRKGHDIAGVTCKGERYMYNGWVRNTIDPGMKQRTKSRLPCELVKYDWLNTQGAFCINTKMCKFDAIQETETNLKEKLCFNIHKGVRTYIYVNMERSKRILESPPNSLVMSVGKELKDLDDTKDSKEKKGKKEKQNNPPKRITCAKMAYSLRNESNSCYMDSFFVALFNNKKKTPEIIDSILKAPIHRFNKSAAIKEVIHTIKQEFKRVVDRLIVSDENVDKTTCSNLRNLLKQYQTMYNNEGGHMEIKNWTHHQLEPFDIVALLNNMLNLPNNLRVRNEKYGTMSRAAKPPSASWKLIDSDETQTSPFDILALEDLESVEERGTVKFSKLYPKLVRDMSYLQNGYVKTKKETTYVDAPFLYVHLPRIYRQYANERVRLVKHNKSIVPSKDMKLGGGKKMSLQSMIVHHGGAEGGHYTCVYRCSDKFYEYDDMRHQVTLIGDFAKMKAYKSGYILKNVTCLVYM